MIFETHAHYDDERFTEDQESVLADLPRKGISPVINVGASIASTRTTLELAQKYDFIYAAVGVHPSDIDGLNEAINAAEFISDSAFFLRFKSRSL